MHGCCELMCLHEPLGSGQQLTVPPLTPMAPQRSCLSDSVRTSNEAYPFSEGVSEEGPNLSETSLLTV